MEKTSRLPPAFSDARKAASAIDKADFNLLLGAVGGAVGGKLAPQSSSSSSAVATVGSGANSFPLCFPFIPETWMHQIKCSHLWLHLGINWGITELCQRPDHNPDDLERSLHGLVQLALVFC